MTHNYDTSVVLPGVFCVKERHWPDRRFQVILLFFNIPTYFATCSPLLIQRLRKLNEEYFCEELSVSLTQAAFYTFSAAGTSHIK